MSMIRSRVPLRTAALALVLAAGFALHTGAAIAPTTRPVAAVEIASANASPGSAMEQRAPRRGVRRAVRREARDARRARRAEGDVNGLAVASFVTATAGFLLLGFLGSAVAVVLGVVALSRIRRYGERGRGLAIAGIILGAIGFLVGVLLLAVVVGQWIAFR